ncbi:hypothetical protein EVAR_11827_1 [Eumeta japonica]|uniref:Uncharacterized protein n=1 Tax=Eumeta variegata TaxID=151549 RepID=A0A4C1UR96_EUMVA|nr:hypothetical protein EVAR_11827_1 [Eumeta japonica]
MTNTEYERKRSAWNDQKSRRVHLKSESRSLAAGRRRSSPQTTTRRYDYVGRRALHAAARAPAVVPTLTEEYVVAPYDLHSVVAVKSTRSTRRRCVLKSLTGRRGVARDGAERAFRRALALRSVIRGDRRPARASGARLAARARRAPATTEINSRPTRPAVRASAATTTWEYESIHVSD